MRRTQKGKRVPNEPRTDKGWLKAVWKDFSEMIRLEAADAHGFCECVTCGERRQWNRGMHAGHFLAYRYPNSPVRFEETNVHPQCESCNMDGFMVNVQSIRLQGLLQKRESVKMQYMKFMLRVYGMNEIERLEVLRNTGAVKYSDGAFRQMRAQYKERAEAARKDKDL